MQRIGRYALHEEIASGGMASVHLGQIVGDAGFTRAVAIKRLHPHVASAPGSIEMFVDEARVSSRVRHRNVVATLDVVRGDAGGELFLVMEYVHGVPLSLLAQRAREKDQPVPLGIAAAVLIDALTGLAAAHGTTDELGRPLSIVHRDVSPQNILVGADGSARVLDFGIAKAAIRLQTTRDDQLKGKLLYMAPEQVLDEELDARTDQFAAGVVLWGLVTGKRLFEASSEAAIVAKVLEGAIVPPSRLRASVPASLDEVILRALRRTREERFATCDEMATVLRAGVTPATADDVRDWVIDLGGDLLRARDASVARMAGGEDVTVPPSAAARPAPSDAPTATATLAEPPPAPPRTRARRHGLIAGALALALPATTAMLVFAKLPAKNARPAPERQAASVVPPVSSAVPSEPPRSDVAASDVAASDVAASVSMAPAATTPAPSRPPTPRPARPAARKPSCAQMYTTDANGIQRVKAECL